MKTNYIFLAAILFFVFHLNVTAQYSNLRIVESGVDQDYEFIEDINGDGILDAVLSGSLSCGEGEYMHIYYGKVDPVSSEYLFDLVHTVYSDHGFFFYLMDMNGDGYKEILSQATGNGTITISRFEMDHYEDYVLEDTQIDLTTIIDIDNDGIDENIRGHGDNFYRGNFDDDFNYTESIFLVKDVESISPYDFDEDGILDYLYFKDDNLHILLVDGGLKDEIIIPSEGLAYAFADQRMFYDADQNGDVDYLFRPVNSTDLFIAWNIEANGFTQVEYVARTGTLEDFETFQYIDVDFDGREDLIIRDESGDEDVLIHLKTGEEIKIKGMDEFDTFDHYITQGDRQIVVASNYKYERELPLAVLQFELIDGEFRYSDKPINIPDYSRAEDAVRTDVNQNGTIDLLYKIYSSSDFGENYTIRWIEDIDGGFSNASVPILGHLDFVKQSLFMDVDGDADMDIVSTNDLSIYYNNGLGDFSNSQSLVVGVDNNSKLVHVDFDSDGLMDLVVLRKTGDLLLVKNVNGIDFDVSIIHSSESIASGTLQLASINKDEHLDIVVHANQVLSVFISDGNGQFSAAIHSNLGFSGMEFLHDIDQDGDVEFFVEDFGDVYYAHFNDDHMVDFGTAENIFSGTSFLEYQLFDVDKDGDKDFMTKGNSNDDIRWYEFVALDNIVSRGLLNDFYPIPDLPYLFGNVYLPENDQFVMGYCDKLYTTEKEAESLKICIHADANSNNSLDSEDYSLAHYQFSLSSNSLYTSFVTDESGCIFIGLPSGEYMFNALSDGCYRFEDETVVIGAGNNSIDILAKDFGDQENVKVDLTSSPTRCGFTVEHWLTVRNETCNTQLGTIEIELDDISLWSTIQSGIEFFQFEKYLTFDITDLRPGESKIITWSMEIPDFNFSGQYLKHKIQVMDMNTEEVAIDEYSSEIRCAYDPNDKSISPDRSEEHGDSYITDEMITYLIRFQNVGNDTAFNILVRDTLSENLDITSVSNIRSSHNHSYTLNPVNRILEFTFDDIQLVDSLANEMDSHGFIKFDILPKAGLDDYEGINNRAGIYFDFNPPVITNTVEAQYVHDLSILTFTEEPKFTNEIAIHPNPASDYVEISGLPKDRITVELFSSAGSKLYSSVSNGDGKHIVGTSDLVGGFYILRVYHGEVATLKKVIIE